MSVTVRVEQRIAFVAIANPPVNGLNHTVRAGLFQAFTHISADSAIEGVVLHGHGACFSAGGDIREFGTPQAATDPGLSKDVHPAIENCGRTVVAAIHGYALGGGLETAMACHVRIATPDARLGLPEARLGVIPLSGTQRLPRLVGLETAIDMIATGSEVRAEDAPPGLVGAVVVAGDLLTRAAELARASPPPLARDTPFPSNGAETILARAREKIAAGAFVPFAQHLLEAIEAGAATASFDEGLARARAIYDATVSSPESKAARAAFLAKSREPR
ncbi:enoyl-CoA hydratase-related protein [Terricaulis silvestris]|uniref:Putative enoyl-CoA hydratase n=1 Tax=Terricaulis silvestris TaxID=2686094 RepID=A0A6I6MTU7_9CAUL|nr:enoyl-CoA hydratase-related protein [Terricaulis silvestris]QGZ96197.1 putative enoyl-CoA hydratase [Terricaulis silvestris]